MSSGRATTPPATCARATRGRPARTPQYGSTFVFDNDFAALKPDTEPDRLTRHGLLAADSERGICRVMCFSPRHDLTLGQMDHGAVRRVADTWTGQYAELSALDWVSYSDVHQCAEWSQEWPACSRSG